MAGESGAVVAYDDARPATRLDENGLSASPIRLVASDARLIEMQFVARPAERNNS
jgi:hypothetical protein